jgi:hypothetical protein
MQGYRYTPDSGWGTARFTHRYVATTGGGGGGCCPWSLWSRGERVWAGSGSMSGSTSLPACSAVRTLAGSSGRAGQGRKCRRKSHGRSGSERQRGEGARRRARRAWVDNDPVRLDWATRCQPMLARGYGSGIDADGGQLAHGARELTEGRYCAAVQIPPTGAF